MNIIKMHLGTMTDFLKTMLPSAFCMWYRWYHFTWIIKLCQWVHGHNELHQSSVCWRNDKNCSKSIRPSCSNLPWNDAVQIFAVVACWCSSPPSSSSGMNSIMLNGSSTWSGLHISAGWAGSVAEAVDTWPMLSDLSDIFSALWYLSRFFFGSPTRLWLTGKSNLDGT